MLPADRFLNATYALVVEGADGEARAEFDRALAEADGRPAPARPAPTAAQVDDGGERQLSQWERNRLRFLLDMGG